MIIKTCLDRTDNNCYENYILSVLQGKEYIACLLVIYQLFINYIGHIFWKGIADGLT